MSQEPSRSTPDSTERFIRVALWVAAIWFPVSLALVLTVRLERTTVIEGMVLSPRQVTVRSPVKETLVKSIPVKVGDAVKAGDVLAEFDDAQGLSSQLAIAEMAAQQLELNLSSYSNANLENLDKVVQRNEWLGRKTSLDQAIRRREDLRDRIRQLSPRAPFDGEVAKVYVQEYDKLDIGTPVVELVRKGELYVRLWIPEDQYALVKPGHLVHLKSAMHPYQWFRIHTGVVDRLDAWAQPDPVTGRPAFEARVRITDGVENFRVNTTVRCEIVRDRVGVLTYLFSPRPRS